MTEFEKLLSRNDTGENGTHQAGILVPKTDSELLGFFPNLDPNVKNPDAMIDCQDNTGKWWRFRFVYYNNKFHDEKGTRNEYRLTRMTAFMRDVAAREGNLLIFTLRDDGSYGIRLNAPKHRPNSVIRLSGWRRIH